MFESAFLKTERAEHHIRDLETLLQAFVKENPHRIIIHPDANSVRATVDFNKPLPTVVSAITGDAIHNLRTALDHLACDIVRAGKGTVRSYTGFPFHEERQNFEANFKGKIDGATVEAIDLMRMMEPYKGGRGNALWELNRLDVADKHHSLLLSARIASLPKMVLRHPDGTPIATFVDCTVSGDGRVNFVAGPPGCTVEFEHQEQAPIKICFSNTDVRQSDEVIVTLKQFHKVTLGAIEIFESRSDLFVN